MSKEVFLKKVIETDYIIFEELDKILRYKGIKTNTLVNKQRRIEKLMNVYLLKKSEESFELNPLWFNKIISVFNNELKIFKISYDSMLINDIKINYFKPLSLTSFFSYKEVFNICIFTYFNCLNNSKDIDLHIVLKTTWHTTVRKDLITFFINKIKLFHLYLYFQNKNNYINICKKLFYITTDEIITYIEKPKLYTNIILWKHLLLELVGKEYYDKFLESFNSYHNLKLESLDRFINKISIQLINVFVNINLFKKFSKRRNKKSYDFINLYNLKHFNELSYNCYLNSKLPMICKPLPWNLKGKKGGFLLNKLSSSMSLTKTLKEGKSFIKYSKYFIKAINLIQSKSYRINKTYLIYIHTNLFLKDYGILNIEEIYQIYLDFQNQKRIFYTFLSKKSITKEHLLLYLENRKSLCSSTIYKSKDKKTKIILLNNLMIKYNLTLNILESYKKLNSLEIKYLKYLNLYKAHKFIIKIAYSFIKLDIYMVNRTDFRGRFFPVGRGFHRASGLYKYLIFSTDKYFIYDEVSLNYLKQSISLYFKTYNNFSLEELYNWFNKNISIEHESNFFKNKVLIFIKKLLKEKNNDSLDLTNECTYIIKIYHYIKIAKDTSLFLICLVDYYNYESDKYYNSNLALDFDQCSSGPMIYSLLSHDKNMSNLTNCIPYNKNIKTDLYNYFLECLFESIKKSYNNEDIIFKNVNKKDILIVLKNVLILFNDLFNRKFSKMLIMPTFYNMGEPGIKRLLVETIINLKKIKNMKVLYELKNNLSLFLRILIQIINKTLHIYFPKTIIYQDSLVDICKILYKNNDSINIRTLDGSLISYRYYEQIHNYSSVYKGDKKMTHRIYLPFYENKKYKLSSKHFLTFPPNWIHSIDGSICKIICNICYEVFGFILEPLHDSFRVHLDSIDHVKCTIKYVYTYYFFNKFFHKKKIGFVWINKKINIKENSDNYMKYKEYLPKLDTKKINITKYTFEESLSTNKDIEIEIKNKIKKYKKRIESFTEEEIFSFLDNNFMFYI